MLILSEPLKTYHRVLVDEFVREWQFLFDVIAGRATRRADFTDKLIGMMKFGVTSGVSISMNATQVSGAELINKAFEVTVDWVNAKRQDRHNDAVTLQQYQFDMEQIRILVDAVALKACHRYQRVILQQLSDEPLKGVVPLARTGVERMLEYLVRTEKPLNFTNLLDGFIAGHSGAYVMKYENTQLHLKNEDAAMKFQKRSIKKLGRKITGHTGFTAEGVYGRSAFMTEDGTLYALFDKEKTRHSIDAAKSIQNLTEKITMNNLTETIKFKQTALFHFGYAKAIKKKGKDPEPKYGYAHVSKAVVDRWYGHLANLSKQSPEKFSPQFKKQIRDFAPHIVSINRSILEAYLNERRQTPLLSLKGYVKTHAPSPSIDRIQLNWREAEIVIFEPDLPQERDLQVLPLAGADLSDCVFQGCIFGENLTGTQLQNADCRFSDFSRVRQAENLNLTDAELQHTIFAGAQLQKTNLNGANLSYANACGADLKDAWILGTSWYKANVTKVTTGPDLTGLETKLKNIQDEQTKWIDEQQNKQKKCDDSLENQSKTADTLRQQLSALQDQLQKLQKTEQQTELLQAIANLAALIQKVEQEQQCRLAFERTTNNTLVQLETAQKQIEQALQQAGQITTTTLIEIDAIKTALKNKQTTQQKELADLTQEMELLKKQQSAFIQMVAEVKSLADTVLNQGENINDLNESVVKLNKRVGDVLESQHQEFKKLTDQMAKMEFKMDILQQQIDALKQQPNHAPLSLEQINSLAKNTQQNLRSSYQNRQEIKGLFGKPFKIEGQYINLQMLYHLDVKEIKDEKSQQALESKKTQDHRVSSFEDLFGDKRNISAQDLFKPNKDLFPKEALTENKKHDTIPNFLLIQGRAGIGKTTFVQYIAREWALGKWQANFEWVFTLTLRELRSPVFQKMHEEKIELGLWEWIYYSQFASQSITPSDFQQLWQHVIEPAIQAKTVLIILDGFDEVPQTHACQTALKALLEKEYASITKIITTRPYGTSALPDERRNCEIIGFTDQNIEQYIKTYFVGKDAFGAQLMTLLRNNSILWGTCHIPVNINLICGITEVNTTKTVGRDLERLQTMTGIYTNMEWKLYERAYLEQELNRNKEELPESDGRRSAFLLNYYSIARQFLAELAFIGMQREEIILSRARIDHLLDKYQIKNDRQFMQQLRQLGIIKSVIESDTVRDSEQSYEFIHLTFQEYYAAIHVATVLRDKNNILKMQQLIVIQKLNTSWQIVWWFVAGLLRENAHIFATYISTLEGIVPGLNQNTPLACDLIGHYELGLLARCLEEGSPNHQDIHLKIQKRLQIALEHLFIISNNIILRHDFSSPLINLLRLSPGWLKQKNNADLFIWLDKYKNNEVYKKNVIPNYIQLLKLTTPQILKILIEFLQDKDGDVTRITLRTVGKLGSTVATHEILKILIELLRDKERYVLESAVDAVGELGVAAATHEFLGGLIELLRDKNDDVRLSTVNAVSKLGATAATTPEFLKALPEILDEVIKLLRDKNYRWRTSAVALVGQLGATAATHKFLTGLIELLRDKNDDVRLNAIETLGKLGVAAATHEFLRGLIELLRDQNDDVRLNAIMAMDKLGATAATTPEFLKALPEILDELIKLLRDKNYRWRVIAVLVGQLGAVAATPEILKKILVELLRDNKSKMHGTVYAVAKLGVAATTPEFLKALPEILYAVISSLQYNVLSVMAFRDDVVKRLGVAAVSPEFLNGLIALLRNGDIHEKSSVFEVINQLGAVAATTSEFLKVLPEILESLIKFLRDKNKNMQSSAANTIGQLGMVIATTPEFLKVLPEILKILIEFLRDKMGWRAADVVGQLGVTAATPEFLNALIQLLRDKNKDVQCSAAGVVGRLGSVAATTSEFLQALPEILKALTELLRNEDRDIRNSAASAVGALGMVAATTSEFLQALPEILKALAELLRNEDRHIRNSAASVVGKLGTVAMTREVLQVLIDLLQDKEKDKRRDAADIVGNLGAAAATPTILNELIKLLRKGDWDEQESAANAIATLGSAAPTSEFFTVLIELLRDTDGSVIKHAVDLVTNINKTAATTPEFLEALPQILKILPELLKVNNAQRSVVDLVSELRTAAATPEILLALIDLLQRERFDEDRLRIAHAIAILAAAATFEILEKLIVFLKDKESGVQSSVAFAIKSSNAAAFKPEIFMALMKLLQDKDSRVRETVAGVIVGRGAAVVTTPEILNTLIQLLWNRENDIQQTAVDMVGKIGAAAVTSPEFLKFLPKILEGFIKLLRDKNAAVRKKAIEAVVKLGVAAATPEILLALIKLLRDKEWEVQIHAAKAVTKLIVTIASLIKELLVTKWPVLTPHGKLQLFSVIILLSYINGMNCFQIYYDQPRKHYMLSGFFNKDFFEIKLTSEQAQWFRRLTPLIIEQYLKNGEDETLFPQKILSLIQSWPKGENDPLLADSRMPALLTSSTPTHTFSTLIQNTYSTLHSPAMFTAAANSATPNSTTATDPWENIFSPIKNKNNNEFDWCFKMKILVSQKGKKVSLQFLSSEYAMMMTQQSLRDLAIMIQERGKEILPDVTLLFPTITFTATNGIRAQEFIEYLLERSGLRVEKAAASTAQHDKSVKFATQQ